MSTQIRSPIIRAILTALATQGHIDDLHERTGFPLRDIRNAITRCLARDWIEPVDTIRRADKRLVIVYALTDAAPDLTPKPRPPCGQDRIRALLSDAPMTDAELAERAGVKPISIRAIMENLRACGHAVAVPIAGSRHRGWIKPPVCLLQQWITGQLFRGAA